MIKEANMEPRDVNASYANTFLNFKTRDDDGFYPAQIEDCMGGDTIYLVCRKLDEDTLLIDVNDPSVEINYDWPELGMINTKNYVFYCQRRAARQWKRGFRLSQINLFPLDSTTYSYYVRREEIKRIQKDFYTTKYIYENKYYSLDESIDLIESNRVFARAISKDIAIAKLINLDPIAVYYRKHIIGLVEDNKIVPHKSIKYLNQIIERINDGDNRTNLQP